MLLLLGPHGTATVCRGLLLCNSSPARRCCFPLGGHPKWNSSLRGFQEGQPLYQHTPESLYLLPNYELRFVLELTFPGGKKLTISCSPRSLLGMLLQHLCLAQQVSQFSRGKSLPSILFLELNYA